MMEKSKRWFWVGSGEPVRAQLAALFATAAAKAPVERAVAGDVAVVEAKAVECAALPTGHAFGGVRALKDRGLSVYVVVADTDRVGEQLARFCLADGVLRWNADQGQLDARELQASPRAATRTSVDDMLARLEADQNARGRDSALQRLLQFEREDSLSNRLQDPETGLFDGPYATLKLDEEWKRAMRFHQPLSLLLLDLGPRLRSLDDATRRATLAEAAGVFLNECRDIDVLARFAPTVFLLLMPGTGPDGAEVVSKRILATLDQRFGKTHGLRPAGGLCSVPSSEIPDRRAFLAVAEACLRRAEASGAGGLSSTWQ
jgi:GGDEF domain-containing protein